jgi:hypothetical protein
MSPFPSWLADDVGAVSAIMPAASSSGSFSVQVRDETVWLPMRMNPRPSWWRR